MRSLFVCVAVLLALACLPVSADSDIDRVRKLFESKNYTISLGSASNYDPASEVEIGDGSGHGFALNWLRFQPANGVVNVLAVRFAEEFKPYHSKWPPDTSSVVVKLAQMKPDNYAALLRQLSVVDALTVKPVKQDILRNGLTSSSSPNDFWVYACLTAPEKKKLIDMNWAGYAGSPAELQYAKPKAAVDLASQAVKGLVFNEHLLTPEERSWASAKFSRDWKEELKGQFYWWVRERYTVMIGSVGDATVLPTLKEILGGDPKDRCVYYAINAITRLTKKDVRDRPVEEMDVKTTRQKVLELLDTLH